MPIIGNVERKNWKVKFLNVMIHAVLIVGAATMVYPLMLMLSGSVKSDIDFKEFTIWPQYLGSSRDAQTVLFRKYLYSKYNARVQTLAANMKDPAVTFDTLEPPADDGRLKCVDDYREFLREYRESLPHYYRALGMALEPGIDAYSVREYREFIQNSPEFGGKGKEGLAHFNQKFGTQYKAWDELSLPAELFTVRRAVTDYSSGIQTSILAFKNTFNNSNSMTPLVEFWPDLDGEFIAMLRRDYGGSLASINQALGTDYNSWKEISVSETQPRENPALALAWEEFVKGEINLDFVTVDPVPARVPWQKFLAAKYINIDTLNDIWGLSGENRYKSFDSIGFRSNIPAGGVERTDWMDFVKENSTPEKMHKDYLKEKYKNQLAALNKAYGTDYAKFENVVYNEATINAVEKADNETLKKIVAANRTRELPAGAMKVTTLANLYRAWLKTRYKDLDNLNIAYGNGYNSFEQIDLPEQAPGEKNLALSADWRSFVNSLPARNIDLIRQSASKYKDYLKKIYTVNGVCDFAAMSADYRRPITGENDIPAILSYPADRQKFSDKARTDYEAAVSSSDFAGMLCLNEPENFKLQWQKFLKIKYKSPEELNNSWGLAPADFNRISLPALEYEWELTRENVSFLRQEYLKRNYLMVFNTLFTNGNAAANTLIYCFLAVLAALLVNPLCAYGLSRYKPASSYKILLFLMLPMAFPGMVLGIPQFLLIKNFGLLNTFAALILPGMASGYSIFLLKGFFDSLPKELFESAAIDGASEWVVFWHIAMGLSTPILSVIALGAFTAAYGNFMMAFLLCQEESMWTMMVYLYQLQQRASPAVGFAALAVAAIPTLIVFIFCQNIIIKGIVVPTEK